MARAMFASFVQNEHRGWVTFDDDDPTNRASFTAGPGPPTLGTYVWVRDDGVHGWFDADDDRPWSMLDGCAWPASTGAKYRA